MTERVIQFGGGNFLRAFIDFFLEKMNAAGVYDGRAVLVQATAHGNYEALEAQGCVYNLISRGVAEGRVVDERTEIRSVSRCVNPYARFADFLALADQPAMRVIVSNTTEAGIEYAGEAYTPGVCPTSFPGKVTALLRRRYEAKLPGFLFLPCELIDNNAGELRRCVLAYARQWYHDSDFSAWIERENDFCNTLVDRIVTGYPADAAALEERIGCHDAMLDTAEPYHLWVIEGDHENEFPLVRAGLNVLWTDDVTPYKKRKVRVLNGAHTSMVLGARLYGLSTVGECMKDPAVRALLEKTMAEEILPVLGDTEDNRAFARAVFERFENPFIAHKLLSIALNSTSKFAVRVLPTIREYKEKFGAYPRFLTFSFAALIAFYRTDEVSDTPEAAAFMRSASVAEILQNEALWGCDCSELLPMVGEAYDVITARGMKEAYAWILS